MDAFVHLQHPPARPFDLIYIAPPQYKGIWLEALKMVDARPLVYLNPQGMVVVQIDPKEMQAAELAQLVLADKRRYGNTLLCFYEIKESDLPG